MNFNGFAYERVQIEVIEDQFKYDPTFAASVSSDDGFEETELVISKDEVDFKQTLWPTFDSMSEVFYFSTTLHCMCTE